ncbi:PH domain-containing protein [Microbacterium sp. SORGH_AS_0888]|uniref:PH domain-containing protein n=1 Tax=Microbacterium sp. SORGH_AS_0888 TaxID=3041791 RepID=UPI0027D8A0DB|nr:PH domain-containing protein [Microbacterium sp. SORGH_AS_0888]
MTNPDQTTPDPASPRPTTDVGLAALLDADTYAGFLESRSPNRLPADGEGWHRISRRYLWTQLITTGALLAAVAVAAPVVAALVGQPWPLVPGAVLAVLLLGELVILPRRVRSIGYRLRDDDLEFRRGILWQRQVAVPYGRMQLIDITHGPLDRGFRIAQLKFVTAAASSAVVIPGLDQSAAEALRDHLVRVAENRRTGL